MQHASLIAAKGPHGSNGRSCKSSIFCHALALRIRIRELPARNQQTLPLRAKRRKSYASCRTPRDLLPIKHSEITILADEKNKKNPEHKRKSQALPDDTHSKKTPQTRTQKKTGNVFSIYMNSTNTTRLPLEVYYFRKKKKPETNKKTVATLHETQDKNKHPPQTLCSLQGQSAPQNLMRERKKYLFH